MAIIISKTNDTLMTYGETVQAAKNIKFGIGSVSKVLEKIGAENDNNIYFGYDKTNNHGVIVARGQMVSSKIVDVIYTTEVAAGEGQAAVAPKLTVKYVDPTDKQVKSTDMPLTSKASVDAALAAAKEYADGLKSGLVSDATDKGNTLGKIEDRIESIETLIAAGGDDDNTINKVSEIITWFNNVPEDASSAMTLLAKVAEVGTAGTAAQGTEGQEGYVAAKEATGLYKLIDNEVAARKAAIEALDVTSVTTASVDTNGVVTLTGDVKEEDGKIAKGSASDITLAKVATTGKAVDIKVAAISKTNADTDKTVTVAADSTVDAALGTLADAIEANSAEIGRKKAEGVAATGMYKYIDDELKSKATDVVEGLDVLSNTVDGTNVHVTYKEENGIVTVESVSEDYATVSKTATSSSATAPKTDAAFTVENSSNLVIGKDLSTLAGYAADIVKQEADARTKAINDLDLASTADDAHKTGTNVTVTMSQTDGKIKVESVAESYAEITKTETTSTAASPATDAAISVKTEDEAKLVKASDLANVAAYAADKVTEEAHRVDAKIAALAGEVESDDAQVAKVKVKTVAGQVNDVTVTTISAGVNRTDDAKDARVLAATTATGAVTGADIATIKDFVTDVVADNTTNLAVTAAGDDYITAAQDSTDNKKINVTADVQTLTVGKEGTADSTLSGTEKSLVDGADVAAKVSKFVNDRISEEIDKLDVADTSVDAVNAHFKYGETNGKVSISDFSLDYANVSKTATSSSATAPKTDAAFTVENSSNLVIGKDLSTLADYAVDIVKQEADARTKAINDLDATVYSAGTTDATYAAATDLVKAKVTEADGKLTGISVAVKTQALGDYAGMTYNSTDGTWSAANKTAEEIAALNGLVTAADVAAEIVADEKVIAAALTNHESRVKTLEGYSNDLDLSTSISKSDTKLTKSAAATSGATDSAGNTVSGTSIDVSAGLSTYAVTVQLDGKDAHTATQTIQVVNVAVVEELMKLLQAEKERAIAAEKALDASVKVHEDRLTWIELGE